MQSLFELYKIGPGPSSSHTIGPKRACLRFMEMYPESKSYKVTLYGSLSKTGKGHKTDEIIINTLNNKTEVIFSEETLKRHPNAFDIENDKGDKMRIFSVGGGTIEIEGLEHELEPIYKHKSWKEISDYITEKNMTIPQYIESVEGEKMWDHLRLVKDTMLKSIEDGINCKIETLDGIPNIKKKAHILYQEALKVKQQDQKTKLLVAAYAHAVNEQNALGKEIVTSPTCGACGVMPAVLRYLIENYDLDEKTILEGIATASLIGNLIKENASISGAEGGCQAEIGTATAMSSAMIAQVLGYDLKKIEYSALCALEHLLGLTCDPIDGYVMIPCIERNAMYALRAIDSALISMVIGNIGVLNLDLVIKTMKETGDDMHEKYRETSEGGLAKYWCERCQ